MLSKRPLSIADLLSQRGRSDASWRTVEPLGLLWGRRYLVAIDTISATATFSISGSETWLRQALTKSFALRGLRSKAYANRALVPTTSRAWASRLEVCPMLLSVRQGIQFHPEQSGGC